MATTPRPALSSFVRLSKAALEKASSEDEGSDISFVVGNESADLDSMTSALVYAYIVHSTSDSTDRTAFVPVINIPKADLALRPEYAALMRHANVNMEHLVTLDDMNEARKRGLDPARTSWVLVDHNKLQGQLGDIYGLQVNGVIDHHEEENWVKRDAEPRVVQKCGSCTSLVVQNLMSRWKAISTKDSLEIDAQAAKIALGSIVVDTQNLTAEGKVEESDREATAFLEEMITGFEKQFDRAAFFDEIQKAKHDLGRLNVKGVLRKDYKEWKEKNTTIGVSSSVLSLSTLIDKAAGEAKGKGSPGEQLCQQLQEYAKDRQLDIASVMTAYEKDGQFCRELLVWGFGLETQQVLDRFEHDSTDTLGLKPWTGKEKLDLTDEQNRRIVWKQTALQYSRKKVAPLLRGAV